MGNNTACKTVGIGTIRIKMFDKTVQTLIDTHVPNFRQKLISLSCLDATGCKITMSSGVMKIVQRVMVIMKGLKSCSLYQLQGTTIVGGGNISSQFEGDGDSTILWHMQLEHMSKKVITLLEGFKICNFDLSKYCVFGKQAKIQFKTVSHTFK